MTTFIDQIEFSVLPYGVISDEVLEECCTLFSKDYGKWGSQGIHPGRHVKVSVQRMRKDYLFDKSCGITTARLNKVLIGYKN